MINQKNEIFITGEILNKPVYNEKFNGYWIKIITIRNNGAKACILSLFVPNEICKTNFKSNCIISIVGEVRNSAQLKPFIYVNELKILSEKANFQNRIKLEGFVDNSTIFKQIENLSGRIKHEFINFKLKNNKFENTNIIGVCSDKVNEYNEIFFGDEYIADGELHFNKRDTNGLFIWANKIIR